MLFVSYARGFLVVVGVCKTAVLSLRGDVVNLEFTFFTLVMPLS